VTIDLRPEVLSFDCFGTLVDWESGILAALQPWRQRSGVTASDDDLLERFAALEPAAEAGPYKRYREILAGVLDGLGAEAGVTPTAVEREAFASSVPDWPLFPDTAEGLRALKARYKLAVITNCDTDLFTETARDFPITFDWIITAEQVQGYKPSLNNFHRAFERIGVPRERMLHVAQSLFHDVAPARELGLTTVWVNRRQGKPGAGATAPSDAVPDYEVPDLASLVALLEHR
jgi:2-haloacid dehalogenase